MSCIFEKPIKKLLDKFVKQVSKEKPRNALCKDIYMGSDITGKPFRHSLHSLLDRVCYINVNTGIAARIWACSSAR